MESNKDVTREKIVEAASIAFKKFGYKKTTLDDIAALTKTSKTGIYYYFKNKEEMFQQVIKKEASQMQKYLIEIVSQESRPLDKMFAFVNGRMKYVAKITSYYSNLKYTLFEHIDVINSNRAEFEKIERAMLCDILREGDDLGDFSVEEIEETAETIFTVLKSVEIPYFITNADEDYEHKLEKLLALLMYGIIPR